MTKSVWETTKQDQIVSPVTPKAKTASHIYRGHMA